MRIKAISPIEKSSVIPKKPTTSEVIARMEHERATKRAAETKDKPREEPKWRLVEKTVALLEKSLTPTAKVEHNVRLPVLGKSRWRQCDIVITFGEPPRQTLAIVEVQKRKRKPNITTFHGWVQKMREVGAQHLICVSALGYPKSIIIEVATHYGPTVRLLTLEELQIQEANMLGLLFPSHFATLRKPLFSVESVGPMILENPPLIEGLELGASDKVFELGDTAGRLTLLEVISKALGECTDTAIQGGWQEPDSYSAEIVLSSGEVRELWLHFGEQRFKVRKFPVRVRIGIHKSEIPLTCFAYTQEFIDGVLAWVVSAKHVSGDVDTRVQLVYKPDKDGFLQLVSLEQIGVRRIILTDSQVGKRRIILLDHPNEPP